MNESSRRPCDPPVCEREGLDRLSTGLSRGSWADGVGGVTQRSRGRDAATHESPVRLRQISFAMYESRPAAGDRGVLVCAR